MNCIWSNIICRLETLADAHSLHEVLTSIPGVAVRNSSRVLTQVTGKRFASAGHQASCRGIVRVSHLSGKSSRGANSLADAETRSTSSETESHTRTPEPRKFCGRLKKSVGAPRGNHLSFNEIKGRPGGASNWATCSSPHTSLPLSGTRANRPVAD